MSQSTHRGVLFGRTILGYGNIVRIAVEVRAAKGVATEARLFREQRNRNCDVQNVEMKSASAAVLSVPKRSRPPLVKRETARVSLELRLTYSELASAHFCERERELTWINIAR